MHLRIEDVASTFLERASPRVADFLEIAAYVYAADASTRRGEQWTDDAIEPWSRDIRLVLPVRDHAFWTRPDVAELLVGALHFLSDDTWHFDFEPLQDSRPVHEYLEFGDQGPWPFSGIERVLMFSGGLDSLAGAVEVARAGTPLLLVSHRPVSIIDSRQRQLVTALRTTFPRVRVLHVPVWVNKAGRLGREFTQRTRSFLFCALGLAVAESVRAGGIRFFENGVVSLNLPVADEVLRARASRTTHPSALHDFSRLCMMITERPFVVDNPYLLRTKTEVVSTIADSGAGPLIERSCSCVHTIHKSKAQWHCGTCSQCIDRRIAVLAAGQQGHDPETDYVVDVFRGPRKEGPEKNMAVNYVRHVTELRAMSEGEIAARFNRELTLAVQGEPRRSEAAAALISLHQRHARAAWRVVHDQLALHLDGLADDDLPPTSMLALVYGREHLRSDWLRFVDRVACLLADALPVACAKEPPTNERGLQRMAEAILRGHEPNLAREYPFLRWSMVLTKPDFSAESLAIWIELKYVRRRRDLGRITEEMAADITKYGDSGRRTLFVVYDPSHAIDDDREFAALVERHAGMFVRIVR